MEKLLTNQWRGNHIDCKKSSMDGLRLLDHVHKEKNFSYPYGIKELPSATEAEIKIPNKSLQELDESIDNLTDIIEQEANLHQSNQHNF